MDKDRVDLIERIGEAIARCATEEAILRTAARLMDDFSEGFSWTGFYLMRGDHLEVGPYVGPETPHVRIELNQGICGAAAGLRRTVVVDDVNADTRFLACSLTTRSEIVVPLMDGDRCIGEIDIDSDLPTFFTEEDRLMFEAIAAVIVKRLGEITR